MGAPLKKPGDKYRFKRDAGIALMRDLIHFAEWLGGKIGFEISADSFTFARATSGGGFSVGMAAGGAVTGSGPLTVLSNGSVVPGTIGGVTPTIGGDAIDDSPPPTLSIGSGTDYVVVTINSTLSVYGGVYVEGYSAISSVVITATSTDPGDGGMLSTDGEFKLKLATFVDGVKTAQFFTGSKSIQVCDDGTGEARGSIGFVSL